ncbi:MAG: sulfite exporter TauE/SafE family protein [Acidimicrobiales bacterium]
MDVVVIAVAAVLTSVLSAVAGLGGGVILLAVLAQFFVPIVAIPIQGGIQLASNGSRALLLRREINLRAAGAASLLILPASLAGVALATSVPEEATRFALGTFLLVVVWRPSMLRWTPAGGISDRTLVGVGAVSGFLNTTVGASGPFTSPFFKAVTSTHTAFVATAAASQVVAHTSKLTAFGLDGFDFREHATVIGVGAVSVIAGSWIGTKLLGRVSDRHLRYLFRTVLTILAIRLIVRSIV